MNEGGKVTLIFYKRGNWRTEHPLNTLAAWATNSIFSHVEMAIGEVAGASGQMCNVLRVFNDDIGTELTQRTGKNPSFVYLQLGCTKLAELTMLEFGRNQVGKPFSLSAMARSIIWPRKTHGENYFCAGMPPPLPSQSTINALQVTHFALCAQSWLRQRCRREGSCAPLSTVAVYCLDIS